MDPNHDHDAALREYHQRQRMMGLGAIIFGAIILGFCYYLAKDGVPVLRQGKLLLGIGLGSVFAIAGFVRLIDPEALKDII